jgi:hypothetical protein
MVGSASFSQSFRDSLASCGQVFRVQLISLMHAFRSKVWYEEVAEWVRYRLSMYDPVMRLGSPWWASLIVVVN